MRGAPCGRVCAGGSVAPAADGGGARTRAGKRVGGRVIGVSKVFLPIGGRFFEVWEGSKTWSGRFAREALASSALADNVSSPSSNYLSAGCSSAQPASVSLDKIERFPFPQGPIGREKGNGSGSLYHFGAPRFWWTDPSGQRK